MILSRASELLRHEDAAKLVRLGHRIAAAELDPASASRILRDGIRSTPPHVLGEYQAGTLVEALWRIVGESEGAFVLDWFYAQRDRPRSSDARGPLITLLTDRWSREDRALLKGIVEDARFAKLGWTVLVQLARELNQNVLGGVVARRQLRIAEETHKTDDVVKLLRASVSTWAP